MKGRISTEGFFYHSPKNAGDTLPATTSNELRKRFVAHRGANNESPGNTLTHFPENTLPALLEAYSKGASYVECDIHLTADKQIIVLHDSTLARTTRYNPAMATNLTEIEYNSIIDKDVSTLRYDSQLSQVDAGCYADYLGDRYRGTKIPLLSDFLLQLTGYPERKLFVELKASDSAVIQHLTTLVEGAQLNDDQLVFISFDFPLLAELKEQLPQYKHLQLTVCDSAKAANPNYIKVNNADDLKRVMCMVKAANLNGLDLQYNTALDSLIPTINKEMLSAVWTYPQDDNPDMARKMLAAGTHFINTNQPEFMFSALSTRQEERMSNALSF